jgi:hypothetical protein
MLSEMQLGYLAGLLDGEGAVSITKLVRRDDRKRKRDIGLRADVRVSQRRKRLLDVMLDWVGAENATISRTGADGRYFVIRFKSVWLKTHLPEILPYLILKRRQAEIVVTFLNNPKWPGRNGVGAEEWERRLKLYEECKFLNTDRSNALT